MDHSLSTLEYMRSEELLAKVVNVAYSHYELEAKHSLSAISQGLKRRGVLLRFRFSFGEFGYADCHPWKERGDRSVAQQLKDLTKGIVSPLLFSALGFAFIDADARSQKKSIFSSQNTPKSHYLINDLLEFSPFDVKKIIHQGYSCVKIKMGRNVQQEIEKMYSLFGNCSLKLRIDFNEQLSAQEFSFFLENIRSFREQVDFIEDPFAFDLKKWSDFQREGWTLACDRQAHLAFGYPESAHVLVIKPAVQPFDAWSQWTDQICVVTSYLGHPFEQLTAAFVASQIDPDSRLLHGLLSHHSYVQNCFSRQFNWEDPSFTFPSGTGFGFDDELIKIDWKPLEDHAIV